MTDDRVVARATEMGMIVPEESTESETEIQPVPEEENTIDYEDEPVIQENESSGMNEENGSNDYGAQRYGNRAGRMWKQGGRW